MDILPGMNRRWGTALFAPAVLLIASCTGQNSASPVPEGTTTTVDVTTTTVTTAAPPPVVPGTAVGAKLTAACPVLTASEVEQVLGGGKSATQITATEGKPDAGRADKLFECDYGAGGKTPFTLSLGNITESGFSASDAVTAFVQQAKAKPRAVPNLGGAAAYFPLPTGDAMIAVAKRSHGELRTATFEAPTIVPVAELTALMTLVVNRL